MKNKYEDLVKQTFDFPQDDFTTSGAELRFHGLRLMDLVEQFGTPLKFNFLPKISENIQNCKRWFRVAMAEENYQGKYFYCYCTKSSHFSHVIKEALKNDIYLEASSSYDLDIFRYLYDHGLVKKSHHISCNGFKPDQYLDKLAALINEGFTGVVPIIDNFHELDQLLERVKEPFKIGIRIATEEEPKFEFYTSRLGIRYKDIIPLYLEQIRDRPQVKLDMLHFFVNTGIRDTAYYWNELHKCLRVYTELKKLCPELSSLNIGGGFPIKNSLAFEFDYEYIIGEIIHQIKTVCNENGVSEPDIYTEFGSYTVGESGGAIYKILGQKQQNEKEKWNMIDSSFMTTLPDAWAINRRFIMFPINRWDSVYERVFLGGITCDSDDYYNSEQHINAIYLPKYEEDDPLYVGFFHTGAYQETVGGYGGLQHCLIPCPKHIIIDLDELGKPVYTVYSEEQTSESVLGLLGYKS
ncbi:MAG: arginine decarboxylase [Flavobacteriales bacterium]